jgi:hypothetical protein
MARRTGDDGVVRKSLRRRQTLPSGNIDSHDDLRNSKAWNEVREVSRPFHEALIALFFQGNEQLSELTLEYGIF